MTLIVIYTFDVYIPSNDSSIYQLHECDLFTELETKKNHRSKLEKSHSFRRLNARPSNRDDFIANYQVDCLNCKHEIDEFLPLHVIPDEVVNNYSSKLLSLCKPSSLMILNGRHLHAMDRDYTFIDTL